MPIAYLIRAINGWLEILTLIALRTCIEVLGKIPRKNQGKKLKRN